MRTRIFPGLSWQSHSNFHGDTGQSLLISLLRGVAAVQVATAHLRAEVFPSLRGLIDAPLAYQVLAFVTGFAHQAVVVFFLISGWLVGGSLLDKWTQPQALLSYAIDRVTRLWTVLVPTFLLMLLAALYTETVAAEASHLSVVNEFSTISFLGNLLGLQTIFVNKFGGNYALWSLANETWYYILFPLMLLVFRARGVWRQSASALLIAGIASFLPVSILLYFALWLLGAAFARIRLECGSATRYGLLGASAAVSVYFRLTGSNDDLIVESFLQDLACSIPFLLFLATMYRRIDAPSTLVRRVRPLAGLLSEFSFTLYVVHVPTIALLRYMGRTYAGRDTLSPFVAADYAVYFGTAGLLLATAGLSYLLFESHTGKVRRFFKTRLLQVRTAASGMAATSLK